MQSCPENPQVTETTDTSHMRKRRKNGCVKEIAALAKLEIAKTLGRGERLAHAFNLTFEMFISVGGVEVTFS